MKNSSVLFPLSVLFFALGLSQPIAPKADSKAVPGVTDNEIIFGQSAAFQGASAALGSELWRGAQVYFDQVNARGGVHGRKIRVVSLDDGYEGSKTLVNTIKLVQEHQVFGLFGYVGTPTIVKALPAIQKFSREGVFLFSNFTGAQPQREPPHSKYVFNVRSSYRQETAGIVDNLVKVGFKRIGVFIQYDAYGRSGADGVKRALQKHGLKIVAEATYKRGAKYTESMKKQVQTLVDSNADAVVSIGSYAACAAFIRDARLAKHQWPIANVSFVGAESLLRLLKEDETKKGIVLTNRLINTQVVPPWGDESVALVKEYRQAMKRQKIRVPASLRDPNFRASPFSFVSLEGYLNAKVLVEVLKRAPKNLTRENFVKTIEKMKRLNVGLSQPLSFSSKRHQASNLVFFTTVSNGKYVTLSNWKSFAR